MLNNEQPISGNEYRVEGSLLVHSIFATIQGEGPFVGTPAIFVRLHGCNLRCRLCDTDYTSKKELLNPFELCKQIGAAYGERFEQHSRNPLVVFTGGEPMRQNLVPIIRILTNLGYKVQVETNGTVCPPAFDFNLATVICSPKYGKLDPRIAEHAHAFKYVVQYGFIRPNNGLPDLVLGMSKYDIGVPSKTNKAEIYIQPADMQDANDNAANINAAVEVCMKYGYRLCLQTHKYANLP